MGDTEQLNNLGAPFAGFIVASGWARGLVSLFNHFLVDNPSSGAFVPGQLA